MFEREENPLNVKKSDIVVGLASYNEADSIAYPAQQSSLGLQKYYGKERSVIINCDNHSPDGTELSFFGTETKIPKIYITTPADITGKGYNFENLFRKVLELDAEILVCLDADLLSVTPEWIKNFVEPIRAGYDFVTPIYSRHKYDGTITNNICYPIVYGLFCKNIRQPIGGDFAVSRRFAQHLVCQPWHKTTEEYGIDIFMTMNAILGGYKICSTGLGAKVHKPSAPKLGPMFMQVVSSAFLTILTHYDKWRNLSKIEEQEVFGLKEMSPPQELTIDRVAIEKQARDSFRHNQGILETFLSPKVYSEITNNFNSDTIDIDADLWVTTVYDMITAFKTTDDVSVLLEAFKGLYFGRTISFMNQTWDWKNEKAEEEILNQAKLFHKKRDYLIKRLDR